MNDYQEMSVSCEPTGGAEGPPAGSLNGRLALWGDLYASIECFGQQLSVTIGGVGVVVRTPGLDDVSAPTRVRTLPVPVRLGARPGAFSVDDSEPDGGLTGSAPYRGGFMRALRLHVSEPGETDAARLFDAIDDWLERLRGWTGTLSSQYTGLLPRLDQSASPAESLHLWFESENGRTLPKRPALRVTVMSQTDALDLPSLVWAVQQASRGTLPPPERLLLAESRNSLARLDYRQAVIDASTAAEIALRGHLSMQLRALRAPLRDQLLRGATLGRLVELGVDKSWGAKPSLVEVRNRLVHHGLTPDRSESADAVELAARIVEHFAPLGPDERPWRPD